MSFMPPHTPPIVQTRIHLAVRQDYTVPNNRMSAIMEATASGKDPAKLAADVNREMQWALLQSGKIPGVIATTGAYSTQQRFDAIRSVGWTLTQTLTLRTDSIGVLPPLLGTLQSRLQLLSMSSAPSQKAERLAEDQALHQAAVHFRHRAAQLCKTFGYAGFRLMRLQTGGETVPLPVMRPQVMMATVPGPVAVSPGETNSTVTLQGTVICEPASVETSNTKGK